MEAALGPKFFGGCPAHGELGEGEGGEEGKGGERERAQISRYNTALRA